MYEKYYSFLRHFFFWFFSVLFVVFCPVIVFYSLGYKFDIKSKKFSKTGAIVIKTFPKGVTAYLDGKKIEETSPVTLRELLPQQYFLTLDKEGFYPYQLTVEVKPSLIRNIDVFLIPKLQDGNKVEFDLHIYKFFVIKHLFGEKIVAFTDKGIYLLDEDFKGARMLSPQAFSEAQANSIEDLKENNNKLLFWNKHNLWMLTVPQPKDEEYPSVSSIYDAKDNIKDVFLGFKDRYFIIHDGLKVIALDVDNPKVYFQMYELENINAKIFYNSRNETLYVKDKLPRARAFSLFKIEMMPSVNERFTNERREN